MGCTISRLSDSHSALSYTTTLVHCFAHVHVTFQSARGVRGVSPKTAAFTHENANKRGSCVGGHAQATSQLGRRHSWMAQAVLDGPSCMQGARRALTSPSWHRCPPHPPPLHAAPAAAARHALPAACGGGKKRNEDRESGTGSGLAQWDGAAAANRPAAAAIVHHAAHSPTKYDTPRPRTPVVLASQPLALCLHRRQAVLRLLVRLGRLLSPRLWRQRGGGMTRG